VDSEREHCVIGGRYLVPAGFRGRIDLLLAKVGTVLALSADEALAGTGIDGRDYAILTVIDADAPGTQNEIAALVAMAPRNIVAAIDRLEASGLVERTRDTADRRRSRVILTSNGRNALLRAEEIADGVIAGVLPGLSPADRGRLHELLQRGITPAADPTAPGSPRSQSGEVRAHLPRWPASSG